MATRLSEGTVEGRRRGGGATSSPAKCPSDAVNAGEACDFTSAKLSESEVGEGTWYEGRF